MKVPPHLLPYWNAFLGAVPTADAARYYNVCRFGDDDSMADELAALVLQGRKRATAGSVWSYENDGIRLPQPGDLSIVVNGAETPLCVIRTTEVELVEFRNVTAEFAAIEGEGDGSLAYWARTHREYFERECLHSGRVFSESMLLACEKFEVAFSIG